MFHDFFIFELPYAYSILARMVIASDYSIYHGISNKKEEDEKKKPLKMKIQKEKATEMGGEFCIFAFFSPCIFQ